MRELILKNNEIRLEFKKDQPGRIGKINLLNKKKQLDFLEDKGFMIQTLSPKDYKQQSMAFTRVVFHEMEKVKVIFFDEFA